MSRQIEALALAAALAGSALGCDGVGEPDPVDFYVTVHLQTGINPAVVDRLETVFQAAPTMTLEETEGSDYDGGIRWYTRDEGRGDEFVVDMTGDYFRTTAVEVSLDTWEIDIPFQGGQEAGDFGLRAAIYWEDPDGVEHQVGYGTTDELHLPVPDPNTPAVIEITCPDTAWQYTCRTACPPAVQPCETRDQCPSGSYQCVDGCCLEG